jgi:hypothetical protein
VKEVALQTRSCHTSRVICDGYPLAQWAAVRIHWLLMMEPPQNDWPEEVVKMTAACQGNCPFDAGEPLMILPLVALKGVIFWKF